MGRRAKKIAVTSCGRGWPPEGRGAIGASRALTPSYNEMAAVETAPKEAAKTTRPPVPVEPKEELTGILLSSPEKTKEKDQKREFWTPVGSKHIAIGSRIKLKAYTSNRECKVLIPSLSRSANRKTSEASNS